MTQFLVKGVTVFGIVPQIDPSVPQPVVQSRGRPLLGPSRAAIRHYANQPARPL